MQLKTFCRALVVVAALFVPAGTSMAADIYAFDGRDIAVPSILPPGTIMDRVPGSGVTEVYPKRRQAMEEGHRGSWLRLSLQT
ncbi:hypothetical protein N0603_25430 [Pseudomonas aeruginosa]|nr:hypothetical protein [Pseudomonas aeruginosa]MCT0517236.1 hypothetical protein [Pseudomonas aeruginosa]MCT0566301.1 hypothetical protein [Pseudomonas aeruginosa]MCT1038640.1 hypothetical protein [Pseudomonas aeruginosa]MCT1075181.1 hypothetical protein [Pseudomonas aeruginosa]